MWPLALARKRRATSRAMCLHAHTGTSVHFHIHQQSRTFRHSKTHTNNGAPKHTDTQTCFVHMVLELGLGCSEANRQQRPGCTLTCGHLYLKVIRGRRGQQGQIMGCRMHSVLLFITWHACLYVCLLLGRTIHCEKMYLSPLLLYNRMFIYIFSMFLAARRVKLMSIKKGRTITWFPLQCAIMACHVCVCEWSVTVIACRTLPPPNLHPPLRAILILSLSPPSYLFLSSHLSSSPSCPLRSPLLFFPYPFSPFFSPGFLPLHHRLSAFSPFSPQPDGS